MHLFWHRRDLRATDNRGLAEATADGTVVPVFVLDGDVLEYASAPRVAVLREALAALRTWYRERESDLLVARGDPTDVLPALAADHDAERVVWNRDYSGLARERDAAVRDVLDDAGVDVAAHHDAVLHPPGDVRTNAGDPYAVFSYFWKKWRDREKSDPRPAPAGESLAAVSGDPLPSLTDLGFDAPEADVPAATPAAARDRLETFCEDAIYRYDDARDVPAADATSRLSHHLKFGTVGIRTVYAHTGEALADADGESERSGVEAFRRQLAWREFYAQVLRFHPRVVSRNYRDFERPVDWRDDPDEIRAWRRGETGVPIVDAGMRQLRDEAYLHNRVRMIAASFLAKDLLVDWRVGYAHFREHLADHDPANEAGGWQWAASTGPDAQPYFRVFDPWTQGERYDPDAEYVARYVPELRGVDPDVVHGWHEVDDDRRADVAPDYPAPIVDHAERREAAIAAFERARGADEE